MVHLSQMKVKFFISVCFLSLLFIGLNSCNPKEKKGVIYQEVKDEPPKDSTLKWLKERDNFNKTNYFETFEKFYQSKTANKNYTEAKDAIEIVSEQEIYFEKYSERFLKIIEKFRDNYKDRISSKNLAFLYCYLGSYQVDQSDYKNAIINFKKIIEIGAFDYKSCEDVAYAYCDIAFCYSATGEQQKAMSANLESIKYFERAGDEDGKAVSYGNIALVHLFSKNYKKAEEFFDKALRHYNSKENIAIGLHNKILLYEETSDPKMYTWIDSTYRYFNQNEIEDEPLKVAIYTYYVKKLIHDNQNEKAAIILNECKEIVEKLNSTSSWDEYYVALAEYELANNNKILDTNLILKALKVVEENDHYQNQIVFNKMLMENAIKQNNFQQALKYSEKFNKASDKLATREMIAKTMELNEKHRTKEIKQEIKLQKQTINNKNSTILLMMLSIIAFLLIATVLYFRRKQIKILNENKRTALYTKQLLEKTEEERKRIASDLHDSVSHELLSLKNSQGIDIEEDKKSIDAIINDVRNISRNLHPVMFEKIGLSDSVQNLIDRLQSTSEILINSEINYNKSLSVSAELQIYRIIQEALTNIIKYAKAIAAKVEIIENEGSIIVRIMDNGIGFDVEKQMDTNKSFGLHNILERSKAIGGLPKISSSEKGTSIQIEIRK